MTRPSGSRPAARRVVDAGGDALAARPAHALARSASRCAPCGEHRVGRRGEPGVEAREQRRRGPPRRRVGARESQRGRGLASSGGNVVRRSRSGRSRAPPSPPAAGPRPGCRRPCGRSIQTSFGHLIAASAGRARASQTATAAASGSSGRARRARAAPPTSARAEPGGAVQARPWRPRPARLLVGRHERAVRRARRRPARARARCRVRSAGGGRAAGRSFAAAAAPRRPAPRPSVPAASPRLIASASVR